MTDVVLVTGATGYVGGHLWRRLEENGIPVRCLARRKAALASRVGEKTRVFEGDVLEPETLRPALDRVATAYYLIHSLDASGHFEERDRAGALNFGAAARNAGVRRIIYLGGLGHGEHLSSHLKSRHEVGDVLRESGVPVLELRASIVLGAGKPLVRVDTSPGRAPAHHDHAALGRGKGAADRHR
jgi:uncharacterized protein YbjT (DUF2867 family)